MRRRGTSGEPTKSKVEELTPEQKAQAEKEQKA